MDNADDSKVSSILNEVCGIAEPSGGNGWVVVTSRQGQPHTWQRLKSEQRLVLEPLCSEDAMVALWRQIRKIESGDADDEEVRTEIKELEVDDGAEYYALKKLCGDESGHVLGGLPLALVQAGSFIAQFKYSFAEYLELFESADHKKWQDVMNRTEELKSIRESQRSIWTTWKISVEKLSEKAYTILRAMAMLGQGGIGEGIVMGIMKMDTADGGGCVKGMFRNVFVQELMHGSSLVWCDEEERGIYKMHRLVQLFVLKDVGRGTTMWNDVHRLALLAVYQEVETELRKKGNSFYELPDIFEDYHVEFAAQSLALVRHYVGSARSSEKRNVSEVEDIHVYAGVVMEFMGKSEEGVEVWEDLLAIRNHQEAENRRRSFIERLQDAWYRRNRGKVVKLRIAHTYHSLGTALKDTGKLNRAASQLGQSSKMK